jgi:hypothetical protein
VKELKAMNGAWVLYPPMEEAHEMVRIHPIDVYVFSVRGTGDSFLPQVEGRPISSIYSHAHRHGVWTTKRRKVLLVLALFTHAWLERR